MFFSLYSIAKVLGYFNIFTAYRWFKFERDCDALSWTTMGLNKEAMVVWVNTCERNLVGVILIRNGLFTHVSGIAAFHLY